MRRARRRRSSRSVAATSAGSVRSISIASSARSSGLDAVGGQVELLAVQRRQRAGPACDQADRLEQLGRGGGLVHETVGPGDARGDRERGLVDRGVEHDPGGGVERAQAAAGAEPVAVEQLGIEQDDVRPLAGDELEPVAGTDRGTDRDEARLVAQHHGETGTHRRLGIDNHDARHAKHL